MCIRDSILLIVIMLVMMKRRNVKSIKELFINSDKNDIEIKHFVNDKTEGRQLRLTVISANNVAKTIDMSIKGSAVFGRANILSLIHIPASYISRPVYCLLVLRRKIHPQVPVYSTHLK